VVRPYGTEASGITRHTRRLVAENGFENVIEVIRGRMAGAYTRPLSSST